MSKEIILQKLDSGENYTITLPCIIGRSRDADLSFPDTTISHRHALITATDDEKVWIEDLGSANGIFVNENKIKDKTSLKEGDSIRMGKSKFQLTEPEKDISKETVILHALGRADEKSLDHQRLKLIYDITAKLAEDRDVAILGEKIFLKLSELFEHDRGYMASFQDDGSLQPLCLCSIDDSVPLSRSIVKRLLQTGESFLLEDALSDAAFNKEESIMALKIRSAMCVPITYHNQIYGLIYLDRNVPGAYSHEDLEFLRSIGSILGPLIENARLWSELKNRYKDAVKTLKQTQSQLIETERKAAYVRLAHAMAHEIRNPMMVIGGMLRRWQRTENREDEPFTNIISSVERVESVLKEVDSFVKIPLPKKRLHRIDHLIEEEMARLKGEWLKKSISPSLSVHTSHILIPVDPDLFRKAVSMVFRELIFSVSEGKNLTISINDRGSDLEVVFGEIHENTRLVEPFDPEMRDKPWSLGIFLNIAHKILSDHGGKILLDPSVHSAYPIVMRLPSTEKV